MVSESVSKGPEHELSGIESWLDSAMKARALDWLEWHISGNWRAGCELLASGTWLMDFSLVGNWRVSCKLQAIGTCTCHNQRLVLLDTMLGTVN